MDGGPGGEEAAAAAAAAGNTKLLALKMGEGVNQEEGKKEGKRERRTDGIKYGDVKDGCGRRGEGRGEDWRENRGSVAGGER